MNQNLRNYISFSKKEGIAATVLVIIIIVLAVLPFINNKTTAHKKANSDLLNDSLITELSAGNTNDRTDDYSSETLSGYNNNDHNANKPSAGPLFRFDPNTATPDELKRLGLRDKTIQILGNYRNKGGRFKKPEDLQKIYGLKPEEFNRLRPYIVIAGNSTEASAEGSYAHTYTASPKQEFSRKSVKIDINTADTTAYRSLYGIGSKLAARIVNYREKLGGFYSISQVGETYGVPDSTFQKIKPYLVLNTAAIKKLDINSATYEELNAHPYISSKLAYLIMKYRKDNSRFTSFDALKELVAQTNDSYEKVMNYLSI